VNSLELSALAAAIARGLVIAMLAAACASPEADVETLLAAQVPEQHARGRVVFESACISCHGALGLGTEQGPPLVHAVYRLRHHADEAFRFAVSRGVRAHHWRFGDMPAVPGLAAEDVEAVIGYVRWLQRTAGIEPAE
jgi:mono/diheme cytochrome c family protein